MALLDEQPTRTCDYCGEVLRGRADKRFCSAECRNGFHNHHSSVNDAYMRKVNSILRHNRRVLQQLNPDGKETVRRDRLEDRNFNFNYSTNAYTTKDGKTYTFCYEHGYLEYKPGWFVLVRRERDGPR